MLRLCTLGDLRLEDAGGELLAGRRKELVLLAYLAQRSPRPVRRAELIGLLWAERDEARARQSLRQALLQLRRAVGEGLAVNAETVQLAEGTVELDTRAFEADLAAGSPREAIAWWGGEFLAGAEEAGGEAYRAWLESEREGLRRRLVAALDRLFATAAAADAWADAERWADLLPLDERVHLRWVEALHRGGRTEEAISRHAAFEARLRRELGVEPSEEFLRLGSELLHAERRSEARPPGSPGSAALFTPDLVGRDAALAELRAAWWGVAEGGTAIVVVEGGEGIGKTLLCEEFLRSLEGAAGPLLVLQARARAEEQDLPWKSAQDLLAALPTGPGLGGAPDRALSEVSRLVPAIRTRFPRLPQPPGDGRGLSSALSEVLGAVAAELPIAVFLDDLPYADPSSRELILRLARQVPPGVLLLVSARPEWLQPSGVLAELCRSPGVRRIKLTPLGAAEVEMLLHSMLEVAADERRGLAERLHAETGGNPYHVSEIVSTMVDEGHLAPDVHGIWRTPAALADRPLPLPTSVRDAAERRLALLSGDARRVLGVAAEVREPLERARLGEAAGLPAAEFEAALDELIARRLLRPAASPVDALEFSYPVIRRVARDRPAGAPVRPEVDASPRGWRARRPAVAVMLGAVALGAVAALVLTTPSPGEPPVIAVGQLASHGTPDLAGDAAATADMLATNLARVPGLQVVSRVRIFEIQAQLGDDADAAAIWTRAARQAAATELIEGALHSRPGGGLRLDLRRVDLRSGAVLAAYTAEGEDAFEVVDRATAALAADLGLPAGPLRLAEAATRSLVAYRFYEEGVRSYAVADYRGALRLFEAALVEDSLFAMAAHYAGLSRVRLNQPTPVDVQERLLRLADRAPDRERLLIRGTWAGASARPEHGAIAETLVVRYPMEPDGYFLLAGARISSGDFLGALPHLRRVVAMDSLGLRGTLASCRACDALERIVSAYTLADSLPAAERVARDWVRRQPGSASAWYRLGLTLERQGRYGEALAARHRAVASGPIDGYDAVFPAVIRIRAGDFSSADRLLRELARNATPAVRRQALWFLTLSLRYQGRLREALEVIRGIRLDTPATGVDPFLQHRAQTLLELGRADEAGRLFDLIASLSPAPPPLAETARHRSWNLTHRAAALAAAGDTGALAALADTIEVWGGRSGHGRDWRLHHHVRGLLLAARGQPELAAAAFRRAIYSPTAGYTRTNLELARVLLVLDRPREAAAVLQPAFRGPLEASNLYVTHTELHALLGRAWDAAGRADSAAAHYRWVVEAWRDADPELHARRDSVRARLRALGLAPG